MTRFRGESVALALLGLLITLAAVLGPLVFNVIRFRTSANIEAQFEASELLTLTIVVPTLFASAILWNRQNRVASAITLAATLYTIYTYISAILGQEYGAYDGNVERAFLLYIAIVAGSSLLAARAWSHLAASTFEDPSPRLCHILGTVLIAGSMLILLAWVSQIRLVLFGDPSVEYLEGPTCFWVIKTLDLGFVIPSGLAVGWGLLRHNATAIKLAFGLVGFFTLMAAAVAAMAVAMVVGNDPSGQPLSIVILTPLAIGLAILYVRLLQEGMGRSQGAVADRGKDNAKHGLLRFHRLESRK